VWPEVEDWLEVACLYSGGELNAELLRQLCVGKRARLRVVLDDEDTPVAAGVTQTLPQADGNVVCTILAFGGAGMPKWRHLFPQLIREERELGASTIRAQGRVGWARAIPGLEPVRLVYELDLRHQA
jgi:hypothetical protein